MMKAMILAGGWEGHTPRETARILAEAMKAKGIEAEISYSLDPLSDSERLKSLDLIVPLWTMGQMTDQQWKSLEGAVRGGVGIAGVHGGMCDAFRANLGYQWMTGGQFVEHPYVGRYIVRLTAGAYPLLRGIPRRFPYESEQYYMQVDPGNTILADTVYRLDGRRVIMPVVWTKKWGQGRVFFSALGHNAAELEKFPVAVEIAARGMAWAAKGKAAARSR